MIKKKIITPSNGVVLNGVSERQTALKYISSYKYIILNSFVTYMRLNYDLSYTNASAVNLLSGLGLPRKRVAFDTERGIKQSKNEFINEDGLNKIKPVLGKSLTHDDVIEMVAEKVLNHIKDNFFDIDFSKGIINFNMYNSEEGLILLFDNNSLKLVLSEIKDNFTYRYDFIPKVASKIRSMSEPSYIRDNTYTETSIHVVDKKFYKYKYKGDSNV